MNPLDDGKFDNSISIIGGGIAGLTAALCLSLTAKNKHPKQQLNIQIFEATKRPTEEGAGLQLSPNVTHILRKLNLLDDLIAKAGQPDNIIMADGKTGRQIADIPLGAYATKRYGAPYLVVHRRDLHAILLDAVNKRSNIKVNFNYELIGINQFADHAELIFENHGQQKYINAQLYIAADGVWSPTKQALNLKNLNKPQFSQHIAWRTLLDADKFANKYKTTTHVWLGSQAHIIVYPISQGRKLNFVAFTEGGFKQKSWAQPADVEDLKTHLSDWHPDVQNLVSQAKDLKIWPLCAGEPEYQQAISNFLYVGDAAHPTLPYQAQGAAMAIEDAACLANLLYSQNDDWLTWPAEKLANNLRMFEASRDARVTKTQKTAQQNAKIFHLSPPISWARDVYLKFISKFLRQRLLSRLDWLYAKRYDNF
ncbi:MAG: FAD-dependent monooxygenase [Rhizobiales bacterium]|nr:FAD-dependent monooxygenase [Hyphomicrobiales bacterium]NRB15758.1 FAD-dependent monooxygenase [Hyphomicrobiales bacterium]